MLEDLFKFITLDVVLLALLLYTFLPYLKDCISCKLVLGTIAALSCIVPICVLLFYFLLFTICIPIYGSFDNACKALYSENSPLNTIKQIKKKYNND